MGRRLVFVFGMLFASMLCAAPSPDALLVVVGDTHSAYERYPQFVARIDRIKAENPGVPLAILVDGDAFEFGNVVARRTDGALDFSLFAALASRAPTVLTLGNHEADLMTMADAVTRLRGAGVTVLSGNLRDRETGKAFAPAWTKLKLGRHELTIVGLVTDRLATFRAAIRSSLDVANPVTWARQSLPALLRDAEVPVVLSHAGVRADREMLPLVPNGTLFIGAHDHLRFVHHQDRTVYFHSGSWLDSVSIVSLFARDGQLLWDVAQEDLTASDPADARLNGMVHEVVARTLSPAETKSVGHLPTALSPDAAARFAVEAAREAAKADAAVIGATTFGGGLPAGEVSQYAFDACVRFDGTLYVADVTGAELTRILTQANQGPDTPLSERTGERLIAVAPARIDAGARYRLVTTDWIGRNPTRFLGTQAPTFREESTLHLKAAVISRLRGAAALRAATP